VFVATSTKHPQKKTRIRLRTDRAWFSCLLRHPVTKRSGPVLWCTRSRSRNKVSIIREIVMYVAEVTAAAAADDRRWCDNIGASCMRNRITRLLLIHSTRLRSAEAIKQVVKRAFSYTGLTAWNVLPARIRCIKKSYSLSEKRPLCCGEKGPSLIRIY